MTHIKCCRDSKGRNKQDTGGEIFGLILRVIKWQMLGNGQYQVMDYTSQYVFKKTGEHIKGTQMS